MQRVASRVSDAGIVTLRRPVGGVFSALFSLALSLSPASPPGDGFSFCLFPLCFLVSSLLSFLASFLRFLVPSLRI